MSVRRIGGPSSRGGALRGWWYEAYISSSADEGLTWLQLIKVTYYGMGVGPPLSNRHRVFWPLDLLSTKSEPLHMNNCSARSVPVPQHLGAVKPARGILLPRHLCLRQTLRRRGTFNQTAATGDDEGGCECAWCVA
jgi:hypothetical protein